MWWYDFTKKGKQDKEGGINPTFGGKWWETHICTSATLGGHNLKEKKEKIGIQKHIRITDSDITERINRVMELPEYKSFNKVINDALFYGLPILCNKLFGEVELAEETEPPTIRNSFGGLDEKSFAVIVKLLKETVLNVTINKSILSSLFHDLGRINKVLNLDGELYEQGLMSDTPDYLYDYEMDGLKKMRR